MLDTLCNKAMLHTNFAMKLLQSNCYQEYKNQKFCLQPLNPKCTLASMLVLDFGTSHYVVSTINFLFFSLRDMLRNQTVIIFNLH